VIFTLTDWPEPFPGVQVFCQSPLFSDFRPSSGSPLVKEAATVPDVCELPQSSMTCTESPAG